MPTSGSSAAGSCLVQMSHSLGPGEGSRRHWRPGVVHANQALGVFALSIHVTFNDNINCAS
eukprot:12185731-Prorocentrum_lima.AAC.1